MEKPKFKPVIFYYNAEMLSAFEAAKERFQKETRVNLEGVEFEVFSGRLKVTISIQQQEEWLFEFAKMVGSEYERQRQSASS